MTNATARSQHWSKSGALRLLIVVVLFELVAWVMIRSSDGLGADLWLLAAGATALLAATAFCMASLVRSRFRFGLRALLFGMLVVGGALGWIGMFLEPTKQQRRILRNLDRFDLNVGYEHQAVPGIETLLGSEYFQRVTYIDLDCTGTTAADRAQLARLTSLRSLWLRGNEVTDDDLERLHSLVHLKEVGIDSARVSGTGLRALADASEIEHLCLRGSNRVMDLSTLRMFPALKGLSLSNSAVTDDDLLHLIMLQELENLGLDGTIISDAGLAHLNSLRNLKYISFTGTKVTDAGLTHLKGLTQLRQIWPSNQITADGLRKLRETAPDLHVPEE